MKNLEKKPFEECKIELIELGDDVITTSDVSSSNQGGEGNRDPWNQEDIQE